VTTQPREQRLEWILRVAAAMCFIGHGAFGIMTKAEWVPFFAVVGISREAASALMPMVGLVDIALGIAVLVRPMRGALVYMTLWAVWTAALRPLSGGSVFELLERAGNYGVPLAFLIYLGVTRTPRDWFARATAPALTPERERAVWRVLAATTALLLIGHGGLALEGKSTLIQHASLVGVTSSGVAIVGALEIALAALVVVVPHPVLLASVALWKLATEMLYPMSGAPVWELIERGGSYGAPLALAVLATARRLARGARVAPRIVGLAPAVAVVVLLAAMPRVGRAQDRTPIAPAGIVDSLRRGGFVLVCRHTETNHEQSDRGPTRDLQRNLTPQGEEQARSIGAALRALGVSFGDVRANPMFRTQETATYAFGQMVVDSALGGRNSDKTLRSALMAPVARGTNRAIVTRVGPLTTAMEDHGVRTVEEGDCFVVQPTDGPDFRVIGRIRAQDWGRFASR
jgi:hypothetical protein